MNVVVHAGGPSPGEDAPAWLLPSCSHHDAAGERWLWPGCAGQPCGSKKTNKNPEASMDLWNAKGFPAREEESSELRHRGTMAAPGARGCCPRCVCRPCATDGHSRAQGAPPPAAL